ncbi:MAG: GTPase ObgE ['Candidatus Kapabacteria' thiocyanatum]|uniref:GTPase Obg n=1 Tax=Candidatus Kapaibacterium thiocyanatum TaxID=1895771 RepID=A0A1M3L5S9_9BACT|nr:GTPase ObgE ['Candidatus Kapabacteria' thiocyanatum]OJX60918.1 MAG: GTPase ObgE ['Candidatus Kapabacteria' thiocyanatum]
MNFIDTATIVVKAGDGGNGSVSFRREKYVPKGGPDGGNGGNGGDVVVVADKQLGTLLDFTYKRHYKAKDGERGGKSNCTGRSGNDVIIKVPCGTVIRDRETGDQIADMEADGDTVVVAHGGRGGKGNSEFTTATNQTPRTAEDGTPGEELELELELKLLADVGLVGYPNVGKSTLISSISAARPKIADYPFTTLVPNLGMVKAGDYRSFTVADIPGLIEGAHEGRGLGLQFLRHVERTAVLLFLIDARSEDPEEDLRVLRNELEQYDEAMMDKEWLVCISKCDTLTAEERAELEHHPFVKRHRARMISAVAHEGLDELVRVLWTYVERQRQAL